MIHPLTKVPGPGCTAVVLQTAIEQVRFLRDYHHIPFKLPYLNGRQTERPIIVAGGSIAPGSTNEGSRINRNPSVSRTAMNVEEISNDEKCRSGHVTGAAIGPGF